MADILALHFQPNPRIQDILFNDWRAYMNWQFPCILPVTTFQSGTFPLTVCFIFGQQILIF